MSILAMGFCCSIMGAPVESLGKGRVMWLSACSMSLEGDPMAVSLCTVGFCRLFRGPRRSVVSPPRALLIGVVRESGSFY